MNIGWIEIVKNRYGGFLYHKEARAALSKRFDVEFLLLKAKYLERFRYLKILESIIYLARLRGKKDVWVRGFIPTLILPFDKTKGQNVVLIHHDDFSGYPFLARLTSFFLQRIFYRNLKKVDAIVTVSEYWKQYFLQKGYKNVYKIYNGFELSQFQITDKEVSEFKKRYRLEGKPIIYLGNCQKAKGVVESYKALRNIDAHFVTSGRRKVKIPARNLELEYKDYLRLLKASSIVITMSNFKEGWCRTTHEAMLCEIPVIGSGKGGMRELLEGGKQLICEDFNCLKEKVEMLLEDLELREKMGKDGYAFAKNFSLERFNKEWINFIKNIRDQII